MTQAKFITFEGGEGVGKSTQVKALARRLTARGITATVTREPGGSPFAELIRDLLLSPQTPKHGPLSETLLFNAARADHLAEIIRPELAAGRWVICDRFSDSTRAYQGAAGGIEMATIAQLNEIVVGETEPDLTIILDMPAKEGLARASARRGDAQSTSTPAQLVDTFEARTLAFHEKLRREFLRLAAEQPGRCVVIDGAQSIEQIGAQIWDAVEKRLLESGDAGGEP